MSRYYSYLKSAVQMLERYDGSMPFSSFQKKFFASDKKYGSKDRKQIGHLCYCYFRLGKTLQHISVEEKVLTGLFLCSSESNKILDTFKPQWNEKVNDLILEKISILSIPFSISDVFPWKDELSEEINHLRFCGSFFVQPYLFLRLQADLENTVKEKLTTAKIDFIEINSSCLALSNTSKVDSIIELDEEAVVQDYNSQRIGEFLRPETAHQNHEPLSVWDCCAGSGGKSLLLYDIRSHVNLTVSDIRESILINLKKRFTKAGIKKYNSFKADLTNSFLKIAHSPFDFILCDAPCTGSGTWARTPEQLYFFKMEKIEEYAALQKRIVSNVVPHLKENGYLIYITCSVFKKENEEVVNFIQKELHLKLIKMELLKGYEIRADSMFVAVMQKIL